MVPPVPVVALALLPASLVGATACVCGGVGGGTPVGDAAGAPSPDGKLAGALALSASTNTTKSRRSGYQHRNLPARVPKPILLTLQLPLAPARFAQTSWGKPFPHLTNYRRGGHSALSNTLVFPGGTTPTCSLPPVASSCAT